ncbi:hypothetical protein DFR10_05230 [Salmonella enterica subsp. enterica serovar Sandiego]|nr:hypothetical protein [Salmonella enterica subsp. enterica]ECA7962646.1 hypothetical protein [Salmonella enterica subsp. enterica serovar Sandiego]ECL6015036.1 hypothetical protein [Salmonella enterica]EDB6213759.1 hypothetical protein [Salmonella enterica subsp. enterica serovar Typhimurium]ECC9708685.1 hypothetical protein [Salmonella enterica subsp. enterica]
MQTGKKLKYGLSAAMLALIAAGAGAPQLFDQFISEKEGNTLVSYSDNGGTVAECVIDKLCPSHTVVVFAYPEGKENAQN